MFAVSTRKIGMVCLWINFTIENIVMLVVHLVVNKYAIHNRYFSQNKAFVFITQQTKKLK